MADKKSCVTFIALPLELRAYVEEKAKREGRSISNLITHIIRQAKERE